MVKYKSVNEIPLNVWIPVRLKNNDNLFWGRTKNPSDKFGHFARNKEFKVLLRKINNNGQVEMVGIKSPFFSGYLDTTELNIRKLYAFEISRKLKDKQQEMLYANLVQDLGHYFRIGSDPEIFVEHKDGSLFPAFEFLGTKKNPTTFTENNGEYGSKPAYWDGFQAEFETSAQNCLGWHSDSIAAGVRGVIEHARKVDKDAKLSMKTVFDIPKAMLDDGKEEHVTLGCMPSLNAYGMEGKQTHPRLLPFRSAGGHIHFGCDKKTEAQANKVIETLDAVLGVACVSMFANLDDVRRREYYGMAGEYRLPAHGIEYRTLSNAWLCHPAVTNMIFDLARKVFMFGENGHRNLWKVSKEETIRIINECDVTAARKALQDNKEVFLLIGQAAWHSRASANLAFDIFLNGVETLVADVNNLEANWDIGKKWVTHCGGANKNFGGAQVTYKEGKKVA